MENPKYAVLHTLKKKAMDNICQANVFHLYALRAIPYILNALLHAAKVMAYKHVAAGPGKRQKLPYLFLLARQFTRK